MAEQLSDTSRRLSTANAEIGTLKKKVDTLQQSLAEHQQLGRPRGVAGREVIESKWNSYSKV